MEKQNTKKLYKENVWYELVIIMQILQTTMLIALLIMLNRSGTI